MKKVWAKAASVTAALIPYYVRIRTYKTTGGKTYFSGWSKTKAVKTK